MGKPVYWKMFWNVPKLWTGSTVYIIGGGPSLKDFNWDLIKDKRVIGCNDAYRLGNWVDVCFFGDWGWWEKHKGDLVYEKVAWEKGTHSFPGLATYAGLKVSCATHPIKDRSIRRLRRDLLHGICMKPDSVCWNNSTGGSAINLAAKFGAKKIVLLGFDMKLSKDGKSNWHPNLCNKPNPNVYNKFKYGNFEDADFVKYQGGPEFIFQKIRKDAEELGIEILNAGPDSDLLAFPMVDIKDV